MRAHSGRPTTRTAARRPSPPTTTTLARRRCDATQTAAAARTRHTTRPPRSWAVRYNVQGRRPPRRAARHACRACVRRATAASSTLDRRDATTGRGRRAAVPHDGPRHTTDLAPPRDTEPPRDEVMGRSCAGVARPMATMQSDATRAPSIDHAPVAPPCDDRQKKEVDRTTAVWCDDVTWPTPKHRAEASATTAQYASDADRSLTPPPNRLLTCGGARRDGRPRTAHSRHVERRSSEPRHDVHRRGTPRSCVVCRRRGESPPPPPLLEAPFTRQRDS